MAARNSNELEGTLLPIASSIDTAVPSTVLEATVVSLNNDEPPIAKALQTLEDIDGADQQERDVAHQAYCGTHTGRVNAQTELHTIRKENRISSKQHVRNEAQRIQLGTAIAKQRVKEGFDARNYKYTANTQPPPPPPSAPPKDEGILIDTNFHEKEKEEGYKVGEYNTESYQGMTYDSSYDYKSVYE